MLEPGLDRAPVLGLVDHPPQLRADDVAGHEDPPGAAELERAAEDVVVAGVQLESVDQGQVGVVGLLDRAHVLDLGQLGEQIVGHVGTRAAGDVVEDDRPVGGLRDLLEVAHDAAPVGAHVVGRHRQHRVRAERGRPLGELDRMVRVVGSDAGDDRAASAHLLDRELDHPEVLLIGQGRRLAGGPAHHQPVGAAVHKVVHQRHGRVLVDAQVRVERRDHRGQDRSQVARHGVIIAIRPEGRALPVRAPVATGYSASR